MVGSVFGQTLHIDFCVSSNAVVFSEVWMGCPNRFQIRNQDFTFESNFSEWLNLVYEQLS